MCRRLLLFFSLLALAATAAAAPSVTFLSVPAPGSSQEWVSGMVEGAAPANYEVVLYIQVGGLWWGPKPYWDKPLTHIRSDRFWNTTFVTDPAKNDLKATRFAAYLIPKKALNATIPPSLAGTAYLPAALSGFPREIQERRAPVLRNVSIVRNGTPLTGICFGPYLNGENPDYTVITQANITRRLSVLRNRTTWVRSYGTFNGLQYFAATSHRLGMKNAAGAWLTKNRTANMQAINALIAQNRSADILIVGSEALLRNDLSDRDLVTYIQYVRKKVPDKPVGTADVYGEFLEHKSVIEASDVLFIHIFPFWENVPINRAVNHTMAKYNETKRYAGKRPVVIAEYGWPDAGTPRQGAVPDRKNATRYFREMTRLLNSRNIPYFYFSAFDEAWKSGEPNGVGPHWGMYYGNLTIKPGRLPL